MSKESEEMETKVAQKKAERKAKEEADEKNKGIPVSAGPVDKIVDVLINPAPHKILEFTDFERSQVALIPQLGIIDDVWEYCIEVALFNEDPIYYEEQYKRPCPVLENPMKRYVYLLAQCRRSLGGKTQKALEDLALADLESRNTEEMENLGGNPFEE